MRGAVEHQIHELVLQRPTSTHLMPVVSYGFVISKVVLSTSGDGMIAEASNSVVWIIKQVGYPCLSLHSSR